MCICSVPKLRHMLRGPGGHLRPVTHTMQEVAHLLACCKRKALASHLSASHLKCRCMTSQVWDFKALKPEAALAGHGGDVKACDWHPTKSAIASGSRDATVKLWDARAGDSCLSTLELHKGPITQVTRLPFILIPHLLKAWEAIEQPTYVSSESFIHRSLRQYMRAASCGHQLASAFSLCVP